MFQLRTYESPSNGEHVRKVEMFHSGEFEIFMNAGFHPVFFGDTLIGSRMPNLTYMLSFADMTELDAKWDVFRNDPAWKKLSSDPRFAFDSIVTNITNLILSPLDCSQSDRRQAAWPDQHEKRKNAMQAGESLNAVAPTRERLAPIASWIHFAGFLAIMAAICALGFYAQLAASGSSAAGPASLPATATPSRSISPPFSWTGRFSISAGSASIVAAAISGRCPVRVGRVGRDVLTHLAVASSASGSFGKGRQPLWRSLAPRTARFRRRQVDRQPPAQKPR